jgi:hypothetical protein
MFVQAGKQRGQAERGESARVRELCAPNANLLLFFSFEIA